MVISIPPPCQGNCLFALTILCNKKLIVSLRHSTGAFRSRLCALQLSNRYTMNIFVNTLFPGHFNLVQCLHPIFKSRINAVWPDLLLLVAGAP
jgi:hypothetical protein